MTNTDVYDICNELNYKIKGIKNRAEYIQSRLNKLKETVENNSINSEIKQMCSITNKAPVRLGEKIYAVYEETSILCREVYAIGENSFLFNPFTGTDESSWEWNFSDENKLWSKSFEKAKEILWNIVVKSLGLKKASNDFEIKQFGENYWEIWRKNKN